MNRLLDYYLAYPKFWDCVAIVLITGLLHWKANLFPLDVSDLSSLQNGLIGTAVSLAGFIIAALTIIVTFRANIAVKKMDDSANGMELLFNSKNYSRIVNVFKGAILELVLGFVAVYLSILAEKALTPRHSILIAIALLVGITLSTLRCLFVLYNVLDLEGSSPS
jgi:glycerol uptake facilitator-like aquaporin